MDESAEGLDLGTLYCDSLSAQSFKTPIILLFENFSLILDHQGNMETCVFYFYFEC